MNAIPLWEEFGWVGLDTSAGFTIEGDSWWRRCLDCQQPVQGGYNGYAAHQAINHPENPAPLFTDGLPGIYDTNGGDLTPYGRRLDLVKAAPAAPAARADHCTCGRSRRRQSPTGAAQEPLFDLPPETSA
ncbi:hypothetical protein [Streptacidiphilus cavernicola]|uniref:Uncharacterized protein n=1 Tax=Streptacidiphilus cavernicola TaxID=3342716 RepID=A0ABV6VYH2_9ACTN